MLKCLAQDGTAVCQWNQYVNRELSDPKACILLSPAGRVSRVSPPLHFLKFEDKYEGSLASRTWETYTPDLRPAAHESFCGYKEALGPFCV